MAEAYRTHHERVELQLDSWQITGIIAGSLVTVAVAFALGVGFGHDLANTPSATVIRGDLNQLDAHPNGIPVRKIEEKKGDVSAVDSDLNFHETLTQPDSAVFVTAKAAKPSEKPVEKAAVSPKEVVKDTIPTPPSVAPAVVASPAVPPVEKVIEKPVEQIPKPIAAIPLDSVKKGGWSVQFGSAPSRADADKLAAKLIDYGYAAFVVTANIPGKGQFFRVRVGSFAGKDEADQLRVSAQSKHSLNGLTMPGN